VQRHAALDKKDKKDKMNRNHVIQAKSGVFENVTKWDKMDTIYSYNAKRFLSLFLRQYEQIKNNFKK